MRKSIKKINLPKIYPVACHTDNIGPGSIFVVIKGDAHDGITFIPLALEKGARKIVIEQSAILSHELLSLLDSYNAQVIRVENPRKALAELSAEAFDYPAKKLKIIAITGTKGKTTTSFLLEHVLRKAGFKTALTTTVHNAINNVIFQTHLTTCHPDYLHMFLNECVQQGVEYVVLEAAAQAFSLHRLDGIEFDAAIMTNFDQEHGEFYPTLNDYFAAKMQMFAQCKPTAPKIVNADDAWLQTLAEKKDFLTISLKNKPADYCITVKQVQPSLLFSVIHAQKNYSVASLLVGEFNIYNCASVFAVCDQLQLDSTACIEALKTPPEIPGRLEGYTLPNGARCFIDYAHTPSSYESLLSTLKQLSDNVIIVFGCGGSRDPIKRSIMGSIAAKYADLIVLTSDNPRFEDPLKIIEDIKRGIPREAPSKVIIELDRAVAIKYACAQSKSGSIVAVLGKGPDHFQKIADQTFYFNDSEVVQEYVAGSA